MTLTNRYFRLSAVGFLVIFLVLFASQSLLSPFSDETQFSAIRRHLFVANNASYHLSFLRNLLKPGNASGSDDVTPARPSLDTDTSLRTVYVITPTYRRNSQRPDITRMAQTLISARGVHWIVIEDAKNKSQFITSLLKRMPFPCTHLQVPTPAEDIHKSIRGVQQRNAALRWLLSNNITQGVMYFGDDDNAYDRRLFDEFRTTERVGMVAAGHFGWSAFSTPVVKNGKVIAFVDPYLSRKWPIDMAVFAVSVPFWRSRGAPLMVPRMPGFIETDFLAAMKIRFDDIEPKAKNCTEVLVWHVKTVTMGEQYKKFNFTKYRGTNIDSLVQVYDLHV